MRFRRHLDPLREDSGRSLGRAVVREEARLLERACGQDPSGQLPELGQGGDLLEPLAGGLGDRAEAVSEHFQDELLHLGLRLLAFLLAALLAPFLAALFTPLLTPFLASRPTFLPADFLLPFSEGLLKHRGASQMDLGFGNCSGKGEPAEQVDEPDVDDPPELLFLGGDEEVELPDSGGCFSRLGNLQPEEGGNQVVAQSGFVQGETAHVQQPVAELRQMPFHLLRCRWEEPRELRGRTPGRLAVVEDDREDERKQVPRLELLFPDQLLEEETLVGEHPHGHEAVRSGLELQEEVDPALLPAILPTDFPDHVVVALAQVVGDDAAADFLEGGEVELVQPGSRQEATGQLFDQTGIGEEKLVAAVVLGGSAFASPGSAFRDSLGSDHGKNIPRSGKGTQALCSAPFSPVPPPVPLLVRPPTRPLPGGPGGASRRRCLVHLGWV